METYLTEFLKEINDARQKNNFLPCREIKVAGGRKFLKLAEYSDGRPVSAWGFIATTNGSLNGIPYSEGDLMKPAGWAGPAPHARGNIIAGTAQWDTYGPKYLK